MSTSNKDHCFHTTRRTSSAPKSAAVREHEGEKTSLTGVRKGIDRARGSSRQTDGCPYNDLFTALDHIQTSRGTNGGAVSSSAVTQALLATCHVLKGKQGPIEAASEGNDLL